MSYDGRMADSPIIQPKNLPPAPVRALAPQQQPGSFWAMRQGDDLLVQNLAPLPGVCVKCGKRGDVLHKRQNFRWVPPWTNLLILVNVIVALVVQQIMTKRGQLALPLCPTCKSRWSTASLFLGLSIAWIFIGLILGGVLLGNELAALGALTMLSAIAAPIAVGLGVVRPRTVRAKGIKDLVLTLGGVHPDAADAIVAASQQQPAQLPAVAVPAGAISPPR